MSNATITYTAKRSLVSGVDADDIIEMAVTLTAFDPAEEIKKTENVTISGVQDSRLHYINDAWNITIAEQGTVTLPDTSTASLDDDYMRMFTRSVAASEQFTITNIDSGSTATVQLSGNWSKSRRSPAWTNEFSYSMTIRTVI